MKQDKPWFEENEDTIDSNLRFQLQTLRKHVQSADITALPVIVQLKPETEENHKNEICDIISKYSFKNSKPNELPLFRSYYGNINTQAIRTLAQHSQVNRIFYDREVKAFLDISSKSTGARDVQLEEGLTGKGTTIAILDTGIYPHPDLVQPHNRIVGFVDLVNAETEPYDDQGHGTHCAGDAAGNGYSSEGLYAGAAPEAKLVGVKVLDQYGAGRLSTVIRGVEWCIQNKKRLGIGIISLSLGSPALESYRDDPMAQAVEKAWHNGIMVCVAAGNEGPHTGTINTPGNDPLVLTVGAADDRNTVERDDDVKAPFSSIGPTPDGLVKPDLYAPGADIISLNAPGSFLEMQLPEGRVGKHYLRLSGTSMATPFCAGVAALLLEANPYLSPNDIKCIMMSTSSILVGEQAGYLDVKKALQMAKQYLEFQKQVQKILD